MYVRAVYPFFKKALMLGAFPLVLELFVYRSLMS